MSSNWSLLYILEQPYNFLSYMWLSDVSSILYILLYKMIGAQHNLEI
jgi:hypothetical protein